MDKGDILAVDDTPASLKLLTEILRAEGYKVRSSPTGELALTAATMHPPELVLLDVKMPRMDGFEVCRRLKALPETQATPVIFVSALAETVDKVRGFELGAVDYVTKPFQREELLSRVRTHLELHRLRHRLEDIVGERTAALAEANKKLQESEAKYRRIVSTANEGIWVLGPDALTMFVNARMAEMLGYEPQEIAGRPMTDFMFAGDMADHAARMEQRRGGIKEHYERRFMRRDGETVWTIVSAAGMHDEGGEFIGSFGMVTDITLRKQREEQIRFLLGEVNHRAKNMLAVVQAIARHTAASEPEDFVPRFSDRIQALAASHDLLAQSEWRGVDIDALMRSQLAHFSDLIGARIVLDGPHLMLSPRASQSIGMAVHELATNSSKYGALSGPDGRVTVTWRLEQDDDCPGASFILIWSERDGPPVAVPSRRGFGHKVLTAPEFELDANVQLDYAPAGLSWRMVCRAAAVLVPEASGVSRGAIAASRVSSV